MRVSGLICLLVLSACSKPVAIAPTAPAARLAQQAPMQPAMPVTSPTVPEPEPAAGAPSPPGALAGIAWRKGDVDKAFAEARAANKPVFLYWGAVWCPPCNQVKATIFNRQDFIERSRAFVAVYIDGDSPNAQQLGERFKVSGYPSMLLFRPDGTELTRLPGEVDAQRYMDVLTLGMNGGRPVRETLNQALEGGQGLSEHDWRMLAYYSWETDEQQLVAKERIPLTLDRLAKSCPKEFEDPSERLALEALNARASAKSSAPDSSGKAYALLSKTLADPSRARRSFDILTDSVGAVTRYATAAHSVERKTLEREWDAVLEKTSNDPTLSQTDRLGAVDARLDLARLEQPKGPLGPALLDEIKRQVARADQETSDSYERQSVINAAASILADAGLLNESDSLLKAELKRSHAPYYFMVDLAHNAKTRGDKAAAIDWLEQAYAAAEGPATRLQWGTLYVRGLIELSPADDSRIEQTTETIIGELAGNPDLLYERNRASLKHLGERLDEWNKSHQHDKSLARIAAKLVPVCAGATDDAVLRGQCERLFTDRAARA